MFRFCIEHQHLCLMRLKQNYNIAKKCSGDIITVLPGNEKDGTEDTNIRVIEVILNDGTKEYLATNLFDSHISQQMFRELYFYHWSVETKYKESLRCRFQIMPGRTFRRKKNFICVGFCLSQINTYFVLLQISFIWYHISIAKNNNLTCLSFLSYTII